MATLTVVNNNNNNTQKIDVSEGTAAPGMKMVESKCAELFANYCDMLLRKTSLSRHLASDQIENKLKNVVRLF